MAALTYAITKQRIIIIQHAMRFSVVKYVKAFKETKMSDQNEVEDGLAIMVRREVGKQIRDARQEKGMSQAELANRMGTRQAYISELETGKTEPDMTTLVRLSMFLQQPTAYFIPESFRDQHHQLVKYGELSVEESELVNRLRKLELGFPYHQAIYLLKALAEYHEKGEEEFKRQME